MATITLKNIPDDTYADLKQMASSHFRSVNGEILYLIDQAVKHDSIDPEQHRAIARRLREKTKKYNLTQEQLNEFKNEGRS